MTNQQITQATPSVSQRLSNGLESLIQQIDRSKDVPSIQQVEGFSRLMTTKRQLVLHPEEPIFEPKKSPSFHFPVPKTEATRNWQSWVSSHLRSKVKKEHVSFAEAYLARNIM